MIKKTLITLFAGLLFVMPNLLAQPWFIKAVIKNSLTKQLYLISYRGDSYSITDSATADAKGAYYFIMKEHYLPGLYKVGFSKFPDKTGKDITLIYDRENIEFTMGYGLPADSMKIVQSVQNKVYYEFLALESLTNKQMMVLSDMVNVFPKSDPFYPSIKKRYNELKNAKLEFIKSTSENNNGKLIVSIVKTLALPTFNLDMNRDERLAFFKARFFDNVAFSDTLLLNTNLFTSKAFNYLQLYSNPQLKKDAQAAEFITATDSIMKHASVNEKVRVQIADYLLRGFEQLNMDTALHHLYTNYIETHGCENTRLTDRVKIRIEGNKKLSIGAKAPEINMFDNDSNKVVLSAVKSPYTLVVFWSASCPHCLATLPVLKKIYKGQFAKKLEIVAVSIDTDEVDWHNALSFGAYPWINCSDLKGWNGQAVKDYFVYATPTIYLLDAEKRIIAKPLEVRELISKLVELQVISK